MRSAKTHRAAGFTLIEVLVALVIAGLAVTAIAGVFGNGLVGHEIASDAQTALALAEERLAVAGANAARGPRVDKGIFAGRFAWQATVSRFVDGDDAKRTTGLDGPPTLYRVAVDVD